MTLEQIRAALAGRREALDRLGVLSLEVFGSVARGDAGPGSDVDLLVSFTGPATFDRYMDLRFLLEEAMGCRVDLLTRRSLRPELAPRVERDAVRVA
ncbi:MAG: nucleotidyltransferase family protein [Deferrisomatales bacterium]